MSKRRLRLLTTFSGAALRRRCQSAGRRGGSGSGSGSGSGCGCGCFLKRFPHLRGRRPAWLDELAVDAASEPAVDREPRVSLEVYEPVPVPVLPVRLE